MSEFEDKLNSLLSSPEEMEKIAALAQSLMGSGIGNALGGSGMDSSDVAEESQPVGEDSGDNNLSNLLENLDPAMLANIGKAMSGVGSGSDKHALLQAMSPYLGQKRREKMSRAIQIAQMAKVAKAVFASNAEN